MCIRPLSAAYYRIGKGENLSELNERKRFVPFFSPWLASDGRHDDIHRRFGPRELTLSTPHLLVADAEQVSHLSTCQKEKLIILYVHVYVCCVEERGLYDAI